MLTYFLWPRGPTSLPFVKTWQSDQNLPIIFDNSISFPLVVQFQTFFLIAEDWKHAKHLRLSHETAYFKSHLVCFHHKT